MPHHRLRCPLGKSKGQLGGREEAEEVSRADGEVTVAEEEVVVKATIAEAGEQEEQATRTMTLTEVVDNAFKAVGLSEEEEEELAVISTATTEDLTAEGGVEDIAEGAGIITTTIIPTTEVLGIIRTSIHHNLHRVL